MRALRRPPASYGGPVDDGVLAGVAALGVGWAERGCTTDLVMRVVDLRRGCGRAVSSDVEAPAPLVVQAGKSEVIDAGGIQHLVALTAPQTGGRLGRGRSTLPPATVGARPRVHRDQDFLVLAGHLTPSTATDDVVLRAGDVAAGPQATPELLAHLRVRYDRTSLDLATRAAPG